MNDAKKQVVQLYLQRTCSAWAQIGGNDKKVVKIFGG